MKLVAQNKNDYSMMLAVYLLGIIEAYQEKMITIDQMMGLLVRPYALQISMGKCHIKVLCALRLALELEGVESMFPNKPELLDSAIQDVRKILHLFLSKVQTSLEPFIEIEC